MTDKLNVNTIVPDGSTLTVGTSGGSVVMADDVKVNTVKDAGGNTLWVSNGSGVLSSVNSAFGGSLKLLSTQTASSSASISFTSGIDATYKEYIFKFINIHAGTNDTKFEFQVSTDGGSSYGQNITSTSFRAYSTQSGAGTPALAYNTATDLAESTDYQPMSVAQDNVRNDAAMSGELHLSNPSSATYVKNFYGVTQQLQNASYSEESFTAGYVNVTTALDAINFKMSSGNIDAGTIKMYGVL